MAGQVRLAFIAALTLAGTTAITLAQTAGPEQSPKDGKRPERSERPERFNGHPAEAGPNNNAALENVRRAVEALTPEQRKHFQENLLRWGNLSPEEKKALRDREDERRKMIEQETAAALQESGLQLDPERREQFMKRYGEGRRQIEEDLRKEALEKRKPLVHDLIARLRAEFAGESASSAASQTIQTSAPATPAKP